jgi:hypothetical protein
MPRQNRVTPFGEIVATPERGMLMGNRGVLHDEQGRIRRACQVKRWLLCVLEFKGRRRDVMAPGRYTELFFLDEATGLAAGHRPCAECRRSRFLAFCDCWTAGNASLVGPDPTRAAALDAHLHADRMCADRSKRMFRARIDELPDGVFVIRDGARESACLLWRGHLLAWCLVDTDDALTSLGPRTYKSSHRVRRWPRYAKDSRQRFTRPQVRRESVLSVAIPARNEERYIRRCIRAVTHRTRDFSPSAHLTEFRRVRPPDITPLHLCIADDRVRTNRLLSYASDDRKLLAGLLLGLVPHDMPASPRVARAAA